MPFGSVRMIARGSKGSSPFGFFAHAAMVALSGTCAASGAIHQAAIIAGNARTNLRETRGIDSLQDHVMAVIWSLKHGTLYSPCSHLYRRLLLTCARRAR